jgi:hypothetical protein
LGSATGWRGSPQGSGGIAGKADHDREIAVRSIFIEIARRLAPDGGLHHGVDVAGGEAIMGGLVAVDLDVHRGLAQSVEHRQVGDALDARHDALDLVGGLFQRLQIVAIELDRISALHAAGRFLDIVLDVLREVELHAGEWGGQIGVHLTGQGFLGDACGPFLGGLQRHIEFGVEETGRVRAIVGAAKLADDGLHLGIFHQHVAHAIDLPCASSRLIEGARSP